MQFLLIPLDDTLPTLQAYLGARGDEPLDTAEGQVVDDLLERCVKTGELLVTYALLVAGRPNAN